MSSISTTILILATAADAIAALSTPKPTKRRITIFVSNQANGWGALAAGSLKGRIAKLVSTDDRSDTLTWPYMDIQQDGPIPFGSTSLDIELGPGEIYVLDDVNQAATYLSMATQFQAKEYHAS